jgi:hypothetical protein
MSWGTGIGAAISIFTILATIWQHGLRAEPGIIAVLLGWALYILDGASAMVTSNVAWAYVLHGTMWQSGHTMTVILAMSLMWMGVLYHHYPVITGRKLDPGAGHLVRAPVHRRWLRRGDRDAGGRRGRHAAALCRLEPGRLDALRQSDHDLRRDPRRVLRGLCYNLMQSRELNDTMGQRVGAT